MGRLPGLATLAILETIRGGHRYGADIMDATGLGGGTVYKTLGRLERKNWITGQWEDPEIAQAEKRPRRRFYRLTAEGEAAVTDGRREVARLSDAARSRA
jgi:DNA-binding PadR family transcriptional regulator